METTHTYHGRFLLRQKHSQASLEAELMETNAGQELIEGLTVIFTQVSLEAELIETVILSSQKAHNVLLNGFTRNLNK